MQEELQTILDQAPDVPGYGGGKWAIYSLHCCWWTSNPTTAGEQMRAAGYTGLPRCPRCGSPLLQAPLEKFIESAIQHHSPTTLQAFIKAHMTVPCHPSWELYA